MPRGPRQPPSRTTSPRSGCSLPPRRSARQAVVGDAGIYDRADADWQGSGPSRPEPSTGSGPGTPCWSGSCPSPSGSSAARSTCRYNCLDRHVAAGRGRPGRLPLGGRAGRHPHHHLRRAAGRGVAASPTSSRPRRRPGRPGGHLHADDPRAAGGHAGLHPHRRRPLGRVRRVLGRRPARPHHRRRGQGARHRRRRLAAGQRRSPSSRNADVALADDRRRSSTWSWSAAARRRRRRAPMTDGPGPLVARARWPTADVPTMRARAHGRRGSAVPALHLGHHGQAQGDHAHHRRLPDPGRLHPQVRLRPPPRDATSTGARPTSAG